VRRRNRSRRWGGAQVTPFPRVRVGVDDGAAIAGDSSCNAWGDSAALAGAPLASNAGRDGRQGSVEERAEEGCAEGTPIVRKNVTPDVATQDRRSSWCSASQHQHCSTMPMPVPSTNRNTDCCQVGVAASSATAVEPDRHDRGTDHGKHLVSARAAPIVSASDRGH